MGYTIDVNINFDTRILVFNKFNLVMTIFETLKQVNYTLQEDREVEIDYAKKLLQKCIILLEKGHNINNDFDNNDNS